jgi:pyruvate formate lyase activating enzyme
MKEAEFWRFENDAVIRCTLCPHECLLADGKAGICRVRVHNKGKLYSTVYGNPAALHIDPIEKKPLYHFYPGHRILSIGTKGCNLRCRFCQNFSISQSGQEHSLPGNYLSPENLANHAATFEGNLGVAFTYNEPTVFYEYMLETAREIKARGLKNVAVSNGYINQGPLEKFLPLADAFNIDMKAFSDEFYRKLTGGTLAPVLETLKSIANSGKHLEITFLVIPGLNDSDREFEMMTDWIASELGTSVPLHLSRYFPSFRLALSPTPLATLYRFAEMAARKLHFVYTGNVGTADYSATNCPSCKTTLIIRNGYQTIITGLTDEGKCRHCNVPVSVIL